MGDSLELDRRSQLGEDTMSLLSTLFLTNSLLIQTREHQGDRPFSRLMLITSDRIPTAA